jgi:hypothetical protein
VSERTYSLTTVVSWVTYLSARKQKFSGLPDKGIEGGYLFLPRAVHMHSFHATKTLHLLNFELSSFSVSNISWILNCCPPPPPPPSCLVTYSNSSHYQLSLLLISSLFFALSSFLVLGCQLYLRMVSFCVPGVLGRSVRGWGRAGEGPPSYF